MRRVVSLVPSHSETLVAIGAGESLLGVTRYCLASDVVAALGVEAVGGTKNPDIARIISLEPDLVVVCDEENRIEDVRALESAGVEIVSVSPRSVEEAAEGVVRLGEVTGCEEAAERLAEAIRNEAERMRSEVASLPAVASCNLRLFCPIWYRPWMTFSSDTYCNSILSLCGAKNVFADAAPDRYFEVTLEEAGSRGAVAALLPTEPFRFGPRHVAFLEEHIGPSVLVDGSALTWYGARTPYGMRTVRAAVETLWNALR